jgi:hypothetical protein
VNGEEKCGGVVVRHRKMHLDVSTRSMSIKLMRMRIAVRKTNNMSIETLDA